MLTRELPVNPILGIDIFRGLSGQTVQSLTEGAKLFHHRNRDILFKVGTNAEFFGLVVSGCYKLLKTNPEGQETLMAFATRGEPVGLLVMSQPKALYPVNVQSLGLSSFLRLPRETYLRGWLHEPELMQRVHSVVMHRCRGFHSDRVFQNLPVPARIAGFLLRCLDQYAVDGGCLIRFPLTRREISEAVGAQPESVIRVMSAWQKSGVVTTSDHFIEVNEPGYLARLAYGDAEELIRE